MPACEILISSHLPPVTVGYSPIRDPPPSCPPQSPILPTIPAISPPISLLTTHSCSTQALYYMVTVIFLLLSTWLCTLHKLSRTYHCCLPPSPLSPSLPARTHHMPHTHFSTGILGLRTIHSTHYYGFCICIVHVMCISVGYPPMHPQYPIIRVNFRMAEV